MKNLGLKNLMLLSSVIGMAGLMADSTPQTVRLSYDDKEEDLPPRQEEVAELSKKQRKIYSKWVRETGDREMALKKALNNG